MTHPPSTRRWTMRLGCVLAAAGALATAAIPAGAHQHAAAIGGAPAVAAEAVVAGEAAVSVDNFTFSPAVITVPAGTRVVWTNRDDIPHTVVGADDPRALRSPPLDTDDRFAFTFAAPGTYRYFCSLHPHMQGTVVVR